MTQVRPVSTLIPAEQILRIDLPGQAIKSIAVDARWKIQDALTRIDKKIPGLQIKDHGIYEVCDTTTLRELQPHEVLADIKKQWDPKRPFKFVFQKKEEETKQWKSKLDQQQKKMNRISQRINQRKSTRNDGKESYADKLRLFEIEQMQRRMTIMQSHVDREDLMRKVEEEEEGKRKREEDVLKKKTQLLERKFQEIEASKAGVAQRPAPAPAPAQGAKVGAGGSFLRVQPKATPVSEDALEGVSEEKKQHIMALQRKTKDTEAKLRDIEDRLTRRNKAKEEEIAKRQERQLTLMEAKLRQLEDELETNEEVNEDISEEQMNAMMALRRKEEEEWQVQLLKERQARELERERKRKEREQMVDRQKTELEKKMKLLEQALVEKQVKKENAIMQKKQLEIETMEKRLQEMESALTQGDTEIEATMNETKQILSAEQASMNLSLRERMLQERENKLRQWEERNKQLDDLVEKMSKLDKLESMIEQIKRMPAGVAGAAPTDFRSAAELKKEIEDLQGVLNNDKATPKEIEDANIKLEKAMDAYIKTPEFIAEQEAAKEEKRKREEPLNKAALEKMKKVYNLESIKNDAALLEKVRKYPELRLIMMDTETITKKHENDFKMFVLNGLSIDELRAIRAIVPKFRPDQRVQSSFLENLENKIVETVNKPPPAAKPKKAANASKFAKKAPKSGGGGGAPPGDLFAEIRARAAAAAGGGGGGGGGGSAPEAAVGKNPGPMPPLPPKGGGGGAMPPLPPKGGPGAGAMPPLPPKGGPGAGGAMPPLPPKGPAGKAAPEPAAGPSAQARAQLAKLTTAGDQLLNSVMAANEKDVALSTRTVVTELKSLATLGKSSKPDQCQKLEAMASALVVGVKQALTAKKSGDDDQFISAQSKLAQIVEKIKSLAKETM